MLTVIHQVQPYASFFSNYYTYLLKNRIQTLCGTLSPNTEASPKSQNLQNFRACYSRRPSDNLQNSVGIQVIYNLREVILQT